MKATAFILSAFLTLSGISCAQAQSKDIKLNQPNLDRSTTMMKAFEQRRSTREYSQRELSLQDLSDLLWAAWGYNRPAEKKRTAPTAQNKQEIEVYVLTKEGAYLYNAEVPQLQLIAEGDMRDIIANQPFAKQAPVNIVIVSDMNRYGSTDAGAMTMSAIDAGIVSQNISLFCAGAGLATVPRGGLDKAKIAQALGLGEKQIVQLSHPVGYFK